MTSVPPLLCVSFTRNHLIACLFFFTSFSNQIARQQQQLLQQQHKINLLQQQIQVSECVSVGPLTLGSLHLSLLSTLITATFHPLQCNWCTTVTMSRMSRFSGTDQ